MITEKCVQKKIMFYSLLNELKEDLLKPLPFFTKINIFIPVTVQFASIYWISSGIHQRNPTESLYLLAKHVKNAHTVIIHLALHNYLSNVQSENCTYYQIVRHEIAYKWNTRTTNFKTVVLPSAVYIHVLWNTND